MPTLADIFPDPDLLSSVEPEEVGAALLELWEDAEDSHDDKRTLDHFLHRLYGPRGHPDYPAGTRDTVEIVVAEGWNWLWREGLIIPVPGQPAAWFRRTRRGETLRTQADVAAYRHAGILPRALLHEKIDERAWPLFLRGDYDVAVFQAFKSVEVAVRNAGDSPTVILVWV